MTPQSDPSGGDGGRLDRGGAMRFLIAPDYYQEMRQRADHTPDCYVRPGHYLHHLYLDGIKYVVAPALQQCLQEAQAQCDLEAIRHLELHQAQFDQLANQVLRAGEDLDALTMLGDPPPGEADDAPRKTGGYQPRPPRTVDDTGLSTAFLAEMVLRALYNRGRATGNDLASEVKLN